MENFGIINQSLVPVRKQPGDTSEIINQLIFGELTLVKSEINGWLLVESLHDNYEGWIDEKQILQINQTSHEQLVESNVTMTYSIISTATHHGNNHPTYLTMGSRLYQFDNQKFNNLEGNILLDGETRSPPAQPSGEQIVDMALEFLHAPYLWGGRSVWGIDCSGLTQMCFLLNGIALPRDAADQSLKGELIDFIHEIKPGDLAFFDNEEGKITHVGIVMTNNQIIHASGQVRIDTLDHQGIYNQKNKKYSHKLRLIKRII